MSIVYADNLMLRSDSMALDARMSFEFISDLAKTDDNYYPSIYLGFCFENEKIYLYKKSNSVDPTTGKWREFNVDLSAYALDADLQNHVADVDIHILPADRLTWNGYEPRITKAETDISSINVSILQLMSDVNQLVVDVLQNKSDIGNNSANISLLQTDVANNAQNVTTLQTNVATNTSDISANSIAIANLQSEITTLNGSATTVGSVLYTVLQQIGLTQHLSKEIVTVLPPISSANENTLYLVQNGSDYEQYLLINGAFASLGSTKVTLTFNPLDMDDWLDVLGYKCVGQDSSGNTINMLATPLDNPIAFGVTHISYAKCMSLKALEPYDTYITTTINVSDWCADGEVIYVVHYDGANWIDITNNTVISGAISSSVSNI